MLNRFYRISSKLIYFIILTNFFISTIPPICLASSWGPKTEPHGSGITHKTHPSGLPYPSFNNFTDDKLSSEYIDERIFLLVKNKTKNETKRSGYSNSISAKLGDHIVTRALVHNNGYMKNANTIAHNVTIKMEGFIQIGNLFFSQSATNIVLKQTISASNSKPSSIWDTVTIKSATGNPIKLQYAGGFKDLTITSSYGDQYTELSATKYLVRVFLLGAVMILLEDQ